MACAAMGRESMWPMPSFRDASKTRTRNLDIPRCAIAHLRSAPYGASRNDDPKLSISIMIALERPFRLHPDILGLVRPQRGQLDPDLGEMQPRHFFVERLR